MPFHIFHKRPVYFVKKIPTRTCIVFNALLDHRKSNERFWQVSYSKHKATFYMYSVRDYALLSLCTLTGE